MIGGPYQGRERVLNGACQVHQDAVSDDFVSRLNSLSLPLLTLCLSVEHAGSLERGQL